MKKWLLPVFASFMLLTTNTQTADAASFSEIKDQAYTYLGTPYKYGGTTSSGFDCSGYTQKVFANLGYTLNRTSSGQYSQGTSVSKSNLQIGDLVFFNTSGSGVSHLGIYVGSGNFIHSSSSKGVSVSSINDPYYWGSRYIGAKRVVNFTSETEVKEAVKEASIDFTVYASRGQVAQEIAEKLNLDTSNTKSSFVDVKSTSKYAGAIAAVERAGIFTGDENGKFNPNSPLTRAHMSKVLVEAFNLNNIGSAEKFSDVPTKHWAHNYVGTISSLGITNGKGDGTFGINDHTMNKHLDVFINRVQ
ncbi:NlpC/P60 family protein [Paenisporosarcina quisquiliarum]|uniref:C40 family peptidase n=1 Tax=Paenisporosarcina quisquiliarum TaxID=365346 RepID=UPI003735C222